jgi:hypothetical protein
MVAPSFFQNSSGSLHPRLSIKTTFTDYFDFWAGLRPVSLFPESLSTVVVVVFPPLRPASDAFVRSLAKFPEFEFLELGMILFLQVLIVASGMPA